MQHVQLLFVSYQNREYSILILQQTPVLEVDFGTVADTDTVQDDGTTVDTGIVVDIGTVQDNGTIVDTGTW